MKLLKIIAYTLLVYLAFSITASAQDCPHPSGCVTISREAALKALSDADEVVALRAEVKGKDAAFEDLRKELNAMRINFAEKSGENTALKQAAVENRAIMLVMLQNTKKSCKPLSICLF